MRKVQKRGVRTAGTAGGASRLAAALPVGNHAVSADSTRGRHAASGTHRQLTANTTWLGRGKNIYTVPEFLQGHGPGTLPGKRPNRDQLWSTQKRKSREKRNTPAARTRPIKQQVDVQSGEPGERQQSCREAKAANRL